MDTSTPLLFLCAMVYNTACFVVGKERSRRPSQKSIIFILDSSDTATGDNCNKLLSTFLPA